jgi:hypothetical protein
MAASPSCREIRSTRSRRGLAARVAIAYEADEVDNGDGFRPFLRDVRRDLPTFLLAMFAEHEGISTRDRLLNYARAAAELD